MKSLEWNHYGVRLYELALDLHREVLPQIIERTRECCSIEFTNGKKSEISVLEALKIIRNTDNAPIAVKVIDHEIAYREATVKPRWRA